MKKLFITCFIALISNSGFAQGNIRMGFLAGINYAGCSDISSIKISPKIAFLAGISSEIKVNDKLFITGDLYFERKRAESDVIGQDMISGRDLYYIFQNDYLVLPVKVKYEVKKMDSFYLTGGFYSAYLLNSYFYNGFDGNTSSDKFKELDFGICIGIGKSFNITPSSRINFELRESAGLTNINASYYFGSETSITTNSLSLICAYSFDL